MYYIWVTVYFGYNIKREEEDKKKITSVKSTKQLFILYFTVKTILYQTGS